MAANRTQGNTFVQQELSIRIAGEAGQGMQTIGNVLCKICSAAGVHVFAHQDYASRVRGGNSFFQIRLSKHPVYVHREKVDLVLALNKESVDLHGPSLVEGGFVVLDKKKYGIAEDETRFLDVPFYALANEAGGSGLFVNSVACGALAGILEFDFEIVKKMLGRQFGRKGGDIAEKNIAAARAGHATAFRRFTLNDFTFKTTPRDPAALLVSGNDAIALGAVQAGCKFYSAYPMSPSTTIMENVARFAKLYSIVVEQAEDEIAAVNMCIGASFAGVRAMTATSGGGFALMTEGVSLAGMTETPLVIGVAQRPAPATGFPTRTEQADLDFVIHGGHGEFAKVVYAPGTIEQAFALTVKAFDIAEMFQIPVIIMTDQYLADSCRDLEAAALQGGPNVRHILSKRVSQEVSEYKRYKLTVTGISPRAVPSWIADAIYADSDEHDETGHITENAGIRTHMVDKRFSKKMDWLTKEVLTPVSGGLDNADIILMGFGSTYGAMKEIAAASNGDVGFIHLPQVWPFPSRQLTELLAHRNGASVVTVENNAGGQLKKLLRRETGITADHAILRYDGRPFSVDDIISQLRERT